MNRNLLQIRNYVRQRPKKFFSTKSEAIENEPIKFSTSPAAKKVFRPIVKKVKTVMPWYQPYSVIGSVTLFLVYFCYLREENDMDSEFTKTLYQRMKGLEKQQLLQTYKYNKEHGKNVNEIEEKLKELESEEAKLTA